MGVKLHLFVYRCSACECLFKAPELVGGYGTLMLRSSRFGGDAIVEAVSDAAFTELEGILETFPEFRQYDDFDRGGVIQELFGITCDPDPDDGPYSVGRNPCCPQCGSCDVTFIQSTEPPELVEVDLPRVTHHRWDALSNIEKHDRVGRALQDL